MSKKKYVIREHVIDKKTVVRKRVLLTRDTCIHCGVSLCELNHLPPFDSLDSGTQSRLLAALNEHKRIAHPNTDKKVLTEEELPTQWLGEQESDLTQLPPQAVKGWAPTPTRDLGE